LSFSLSFSFSFYFFYSLFPSSNMRKDIERSNEWQWLTQKSVQS
jgi:hypothetical protein